MKIKNIGIVMLLSLSTVIGNAQGSQRRTVAERVSAAMDKITVFNLDKERSIKADSAFTGYYKALDAKREEMRATGSLDREKMRAEMQKLGSERDEKLKKLFN